MKLIVDGKEIECKEFQLVGYNPTFFEDGKIIILAKDKWVKKADLTFDIDKQLDGILDDGGKT